jgi:hypothetical protein
MARRAGRSRRPPAPAGRTVPRVVGQGNRRWALAMFDGPARAIQCAHSINESVRGLDIEVRSGLHTGELELLDGDASGFAVNLAARVVEQAEPGEVLVSRTVVDSSRDRASRSKTAACMCSRAGPGSGDSTPSSDSSAGSAAHSHLRVGFDCNASGTGLAWRHTNGLPGSPKVGTNLPLWIFDTTPHPCGGSCLCAVVQSIPARSPPAV